MLEQNKQIAIRINEEVFNEKKMEAIDELFVENYVWHGAPPGFPPGVAGVKIFVQAVHQAFPDYHVDTEDVIAEGDRVVVRCLGRGTHQGEFMGIPATGNSITIPCIVIYRMADGKAQEEWMIGDNLDLMQQLGAIPK